MCLKVFSSLESVDIDFRSYVVYIQFRADKDMYRWVRNYYINDWWPIVIMLSLVMANSLFPFGTTLRQDDMLWSFV